MRIRNVLFVCSGNTCRSPMAAALMRQLWQEAQPGFELMVTSAGIGAFPGAAATGHALAVLRSRGVDIAGHRSQMVTTELLKQVDLVLTMTEKHKGSLLSHWPGLGGRVYTLGEYAGTGADVTDPYGGPLTAYQETAESLEQLIRAAIERIRREESSTHEGGNRI